MTKPDKREACQKTDDLGRFLNMEQTMICAGCNEEISASHGPCPLIWTENKTYHLGCVPTTEAPSALQLRPPFEIYYDGCCIADANGHICSAENKDIAKAIFAALNRAAALGASDEGAK